MRFPLHPCAVLFLSLLMCLLSSMPAHAADDAVLTLALPGQQQKLARANLLRHPETKVITIPDDPSYRRTMSYQAIPLSAIVRDLRGIDTLQFRSADGFVANIPGELFRSAAQAWIAIEPATRPWPPLKEDGPSAGAFYLVWLQPEQGGVSPEQWPFQIVAISNVAALTVRYPQLLPDALEDDPQQQAVQRGLRQFLAQCASCHRLNGGGDAALGPDLNLPFNPTEYFHEDFLRRLIREPAAVRAWPQSAMPGFGEAVLSETDLDDLLAYLRQMARQRK
ncbi:cytochrome c [Oxalicibacterium flavum]|nr:cytochrome c [Oxalicibacterium flavum]